MKIVILMDSECAQLKLLVVHNRIHSAEGASDWKEPENKKEEEKKNEFIHIFPFAIDVVDYCV